MVKREEILRLTLYTGSNGRKGCSCKCIGCSQESYGNSTPLYSGTKDQVKELLNLIPNVKDCIILGNPDPSIDPEFCNWTAKYMIEKGIRVRFSSSGYRAMDTVKKLLDGLDKNYVDYMSYSIDTVDENILEMLKGRKISLDEVNESIEYCIKQGVYPKIQPTLWRCNKDGYRELVEYYLNRGVKWFSFHVGSFESFRTEKKGLEHLKPKEWIEIRNDLMKMCNEQAFSVHMPYIFMNDEEYEEFKKIRGNRCVPSELKNTQVWIEKDGYRTTHCPLLREIRCFEYDLKSGDTSKIDFSTSRTGYCPVAAASLGKDNCKHSINGCADEFLIDGVRYHTICRSYNYNHNRPYIY